jgi:hypothetical protein
LAYYLTNLTSEGKPSFDLPSEAIADPGLSIGVAEGLWDEYRAMASKSPWHQIKTAGMFVDKLIEHFASHITKQTLAYGNDRDFQDHERNVRFLASEPRDHRAKMAHAMLQKIETTPPNIRTSVVIKSANPDTVFVFLLFPRSTGQTQHNYRIERQSALTAYAHVIKLQNPTANFVYGVATEPGPSPRRRSEDLMSFDFREWKEVDNAQAREIQRRGHILETFSERQLFLDPPNTLRRDLSEGNRRERRKARARRRKG